MAKINQIDLISAIFKHLEKRHKIKTLPSYAINAVIQAANAIIEECEREPRLATPGMGYSKWLESDDTGMSSKFMGSVLNGSGGCEHAIPYDADDFGRCVRLIDAVPAFYERIGRLKSHGDVWQQIAERWDELEKLYREDQVKLATELGKIRGG